MTPADLNSLEMAVVAELNLEMAREYDEVAEDATQRPETRRTAHGVAARWRQRTRAWLTEAQRLGAESLLPEWRPTREPAMA